MEQRRPQLVVRCDAANGGCASFGAGHHTHTVQATLAGTSPAGWQHAVVDEVEGLLLTLALADRTGMFVVWHHLPLAGVLAPGDSVRLHVRHSLLEIGTGWLSVAVSD